MVDLEEDVRKNEWRGEDSPADGGEGPMRATELSSSRLGGETGRRPDPAHGRRLCPCPCLCRVPVDKRSLKDTPQTGQMPDDPTPVPVRILFDDMVSEGG